jgi:TetR/AcrR family transcriptional regulator, transcriptional repressor for nem operon
MADHVLDAGRVDARDGPRPPAERLGAYIDAYLSPAHRDARSSGCPMAALAVDLPRLSPGNLRSPTS